MTLIELLVVVANLGVLSAVVPNLIMFIGAGQEEAKAIELYIVQTAALTVTVYGVLGTCIPVVDLHLSLCHVVWKIALPVTS